MMNRGLSTIEVEILRQELNSLRTRNLRQSTFEDKMDLVAKLGLKILPSEDLKSRKICCRLNLVEVSGKREQNGFAKVTFGGLYRTVPELFFEKKQLIPALQQLLVSYSKPTS